MKHNKASGVVQMEAAESEGDLLDKYQPSDGFSDVMDEFDMHETRMAANGGRAASSGNVIPAMLQNPGPGVETVYK